MTMESQQQPAACYSSCLRCGVADAVVETYERTCGETWRRAKKSCDARTRLQHFKTFLRSFKLLRVALLKSMGDETSLDVATDEACVRQASSKVKKGRQLFPLLNKYFSNAPIAFAMFCTAAHHLATIHRMKST